MTSKKVTETDVKEKIAIYQSGKTKTAAPSLNDAKEEVPAVAPRSEMEWNDLISHRIEEAMRNGAFDNLRNKGKPLSTTRNPFVPEDRQMANDLLKNNGLAPQWIADRTAMLHAIEAFRTKFSTTAIAYHDALTNADNPIARNHIRDQWAIQLDTWQEEIRGLNQRINAINLQQPITRLEIFKLLLDEELKRAGLTRQL
ncbi:MAG: DUF1992 domain-containing protein [Caldilineaceae bacterium]